MVSHGVQVELQQAIHSIHCSLWGRRIRRWHDAQSLWRYRQKQHRSRKLPGPRVIFGSDLCLYPVTRQQRSHIPHTMLLFGAFQCIEDARALAMLLESTALPI
jgi:hypothetical protein